MDRSILLFRLEPGQLPAEPGHAQLQNFTGNLKHLMEGWTILSHTATFGLDGSMIVSVLMERGE